MKGDGLEPVEESAAGEVGITSHIIPPSFDRSGSVMDTAVAALVSAVTDRVQ
jgi:hypothetical protein